MFVRVKTIKEKPYLYLVENKWCKGKVKQAVKKYIGRVIEPEKNVSDDYFDHYGITNVNSYIRSKDRRDVVKDLVAFELYSHGFENKGKKWKKDNVVVDLRNLTVKIKKRDTALKLNEGYFYSEILKKLVKFKPGRDKEKSGMELARMFVDAGVTVPQEIFVGLIMGKSFTQAIE